MRGEGTPAEPAHHPDLAELGRSLRARMDRTLDAEMSAARAAARRRRTMRDRLLDAEDASMSVTIRIVDGSMHRGTIEAVGVDHLDLRCIDGSRTIAVSAISTLERA